MLPGIARTIGDILAEMAARTGNAREMQEMRDAQLAYQKYSSVWLQGTVKVWSAELPLARTSPLMSDLGKLELVGNEAVENKILASRLALRLLDFSSWELNDLRLRIQSLENIVELNKQDIFRPEVLAQGLIQQWTQAPLSPSIWMIVQDSIQKTMAMQMLDIYHATNEFLIEQGVMAEIDLRALVRRTPSGATTNIPLSPAANTDGPAEKTGGDGGGPDALKQEARKNSADGSDKSNGTPTGSGGEASASPGQASLQALAAPLARIRVKAQGVIGRLKNMLTSRVENFDEPQNRQASPQLEQALNRLKQVEEENAGGRTLHAQEFDMAHAQSHVDDAMSDVRQRTSVLKQAASTTAEKATIEIVALMFQSILAEDRIPPGIRVWFARLQMPVLRVAIAEPEFFGSLQHPARQLIDRMGSCALGFDVTVAGSVLETEIKRVVQVIEQYPETGRRVFQLVYDEFDKFLSRFFAEQGSVARVVSLAQQLEQKETMAIQYTIEMRTMLNGMPVRDDIREFLFKVWAEVLALAAMKNGPQHAQTLLFKQTAADLVWAASAKPNRSDRTRVIAALPKQLQLLRQGMTLLSLSQTAQDAQLKIISDTLADAFMSKTDVIP
ncbi:MAG: hypothetical protein JWR60_1708, partial [Polaromonas sp.]|nr:hypothetical protein [Polaromonas sp.]